MRRIVGLFVLTVVGLSGASGNGVYAFKEFPVSSVYKGKLARPSLESKWARTYRTAIRKALKEEGVNFAGHYTLARWGCGTSCSSFAMVDAISGRVFDPPFEILARIDGTGNDFEGLLFRSNSNLLIASGCPEEKDCGVRYYRWDGETLLLLKTVLVGPKPN